MKNKKRLIGLVIGLVLVLSWSFSWAGGEGQPPAAGVSGPEIWGVVVIDCLQGQASLRVKTINNCVVDTDAFLSLWLQCPSTVSEILWFIMDPQAINLTAMGITGAPIITKVKNFELKNGGDLVSFDAQIRSTP